MQQLQCIIPEVGIELLCVAHRDDSRKPADELLAIRLNEIVASVRYNVFTR